MNEKDGAAPRDDLLVQSLLRGLDLLRCLAQSPAGLSLREATEAVHLKQSTVYKLLQTLVAAGFARKSGRPVRYCLGAAAGELAGQYCREPLRRRAEGAVAELFEACRACRPNVVLTEPAGGEVAIVLRMSAERPGVLERPEGRFMSPYANACSLAFLALWPDGERAAYQRRHPFWEEGAMLWESPEALEEQLGSIRRAGYAVPEFPGRSLRLAAAPVFGPGQRLLAVLGLSMPGTGLANALWQTQVQRLLQTAAALSATTVHTQDGTSC